MEINTTEIETLPEIPETFRVGGSYVLVSIEEARTYLAGNEPPDVFLQVVPASTAGSGMVKYVNVRRMIQRICIQNGIQFKTVAPVPIRDSLRGNDIYPDIGIDYAGAELTTDFMYAFWEQTMTGIIREEIAKGNRNFAILYEGYPAYVPRGVQRALVLIAQMKGLEYIDGVTIRLIGRDSSLPDLPNNQWGGRFDRNAYTATRVGGASIQTFFITNSGVPNAGQIYRTGTVPVERFAPSGQIVIDSAPPYTPEDLAMLGNAAEWGPQVIVETLRTMEQPQRLQQILNDIERDGRIPIGFFPNGAIFQRQAWMTDTQLDNARDGLKKFMRAAINIARQNQAVGRKFSLIVPREAVLILRQPGNTDIMEQLQDADVALRSRPQLPRPAAVALANLVGRKGAVIVRTAQTNTYIEVLAAPDVGCGIFTIPAEGYMNTDATDPNASTIGVPVSSASAEIGEIELMIRSALKYKNDPGRSLMPLFQNYGFERYVAVICGINIG